MWLRGGCGCGLPAPRWGKEEETLVLAAREVSEEGGGEYVPGESAMTNAGL